MVAKFDRGNARGGSILPVRPARACASEPRRSTLLYAGVFEPTHTAAVPDLGGRRPAKTPKARHQDHRIHLIGQVVYFRIGREAVMRRMGWDDIGPTRSQAMILPVVNDNLAAILAREQREQSMSFCVRLPLVAALFPGCDHRAPLAVGYVEGEYVLLAPIEVARVVDRPRQWRAASAPAVAIAQLETATPTIAVAQAEARLPRPRRSSPT